MAELTKIQMQEKIDSMQEKLYDAKIEIRPTLTSEIEEIEKACSDDIDKLREKEIKKISGIQTFFSEKIKERIDVCEKVTGRFYQGNDFSLYKEYNKSFFDTLS